MFVCTGNIFRSPMAQSYLGAIARDRGLELSVDSAGTLEGDRMVSPNAIEVIGTHGLDISGRKSKLLDASIVRESDLVVGMAREHVREAVALEPSAWPRAFTLKELVRRGEAAGPRPRSEPLAEWLETVAAGRKREELMGWSEEDDVEDPMDRGPAVYRATAHEIHDLVERLAALIEPIS